MPPLTPYPVLDYVICGLIGSILYILSAKFLWDQDNKWVIPAVRRIGTGAILGLVVYIFNLPNSITALTAGYVGIDWIEGLIYKKLGEKTEKKGMSLIALILIIVGLILTAAGAIVIAMLGLDPVGCMLILAGLASFIVGAVLGKPS